MTATMLEEYGRILLAVMIWREAQNQGELGMRAVAWTARNRMLARWWNGSWIANILARNQFTSMTVPGDRMLSLWPRPDLDERTIGQLAFKIADDVWHGHGEDPTHGALYYENPDTATSKWFIDEVRGKMRVTARIGDHVFYAPRGDADADGAGV